MAARGKAKPIKWLVSDSVQREPSSVHLDIRLAMDKNSVRGGSTIIFS